MDSVEQHPSLRPILSLFDVAFDRFFCVLLFITVFLPSGAVYGFNFKYPIYLVLLPLALFSVFRRGQSTPGHLVMMLAVPGILAGWMVLAFTHGINTPSVVRQYTDILLTFLLCWLVTIFCGTEEVRRLRFLRLILNAEVAASLLKLGLITFAVLRGIPVVDMVLWLDTVFGVDLMTMDLGSLFGRVQFFSDALIPICIFSLLRYRDRLCLGNLRASLTMLLLITSVLFSFSRYFWAFTAFAFVLGLVLGRRDKFQVTLIVVLSASIAASLPALIPLYELRFSKEVAGESDSQRTEQIPALKQLFLDAPIFGNGLGSYSNQVIRGTTEASRSSYEVQLLALPAQIGLVGMFFLVALASFYYSRLWWRSSLAATDQVGIALLLVFWIGAGLTNPLLFHPIAGVIYASLGTLSGMLSINSKTSEA